MRWLFLGILALAACGDDVQTEAVLDAPNTSDPIVDANRNIPQVLTNTQRTEVVKVLIPVSATSASLCTGTLIAPRIVLTAGHCTRSSKNVFHSTDIQVFVRGDSVPYAVMGVIEPDRWMSTDNYGVGYNQWLGGTTSEDEQILGKYTDACTGTAKTVCDQIKATCDKNNNGIADGNTYPNPVGGKTFDEAVCISGEFAKKVDAAVTANASLSVLADLYIMRDKLAGTYGVSIPFFWAEDRVSGVTDNTTGYDISLLVLAEAVASNLAAPVAIESLCESAAMQTTAETAPRPIIEGCIMGYGGTSPDPHNLLNLGYANATGTAKYGSVDIAAFGGTQLWVRGGRSLGLASNCEGDSGGPVFPGACSTSRASTDRVAGLVSFAADYAGYCTLGSVHTRVGSFAGWIKAWAAQLALLKNDNTGFVIKSTQCCGDGFPDAGEACDGTSGCNAQCGSNVPVETPDEGATHVTDAGGSNRTTISFGDDELGSAEGCSGCHQGAGGSMSSILLLLGLGVMIVSRKRLARVRNHALKPRHPRL